MFGAAIVGSPPPQSTEERVAQLESQVTELQTNLGKIDRKVDQQKNELRAELDREAAARQAGDEGVSKKLEEGTYTDFIILDGTWLKLEGCFLAQIPLSKFPERRHITFALPCRSRVSPERNIGQDFLCSGSCLLGC
jgi:hypothetical protein